MQAVRLAAAVGGILLAGFLSTAALGQELGPTVGEKALERISQNEGLYDRAIAEYDQAIKLKPDYAKAYYNRGVAYMSKGLYDRAIEDYDTAIRLRPDYAKA
ncbi:MAG: tetratricopeptide repeat protein, partial [Alphaproteobacteria bacterium]